MTMTSAELRRAFLDFFAERDHEIVPSSSLVPGNDPTLLFTNAGMVQFKDVFLGGEQRAIPRAASAQRCVRAGGKHNDLENVGYTARHHTFFEMLGNFSFGDYFKKTAIEYAWEFITGTLSLPSERLWCTVYEDDDEAADIWLKHIGVDPQRFGRMGAKDNFWAMGDTGPCGPCTEIFYDHGPEVPGGPPGSPDEDGDRYVEIWNLVFMQFERDAAAELKPLPRPSVDTGMGLERLAAVLQGVHSNYDIDLLRSIIEDAAFVTGTRELQSSSLRVIADHIRACSFLITDGVIPGNEGRGYVLRRIIRRAIRHGYKLGVEEPFFHTLVASVEREMGAAYPELTRAQEQVERVLRQEEDRFAETLAQGMRMLEETIAGLSDARIPGEDVFKLYDTYGFPEDLTADIARERGLTIDHAGFAEAMQGQRQRARAASRFQANQGRLPALDVASEFVGYDTIRATGSIVALLCEGKPVETLQAQQEGIVVLDRTPFYAESGGQVGDVGLLEAAGEARFEVSDTQKLGSAIGHLGRVVEGRIAVGDEVTASVAADARAATVLNHSATHLMHAALREVLGEHVQQKGSLVDPGRLRFDFSHFEPVSGGQLAEIEARVNREIRANAQTQITEMPYEDALAAGALAFFGDKYADQVRVLKLGDYSVELCGGTHVKRTGDIGVFKILSESGIAAGVRRIEAVTGRNALDLIGHGERALKRVAELVKGGRDDVVEKVGQIVERNRSLEKELDRLKSQLASGGARDLMSQTRQVAGVKVLAARLDGADAKALRDAVDQMKDKLGSGVVVLGAVEDGKVRLVAGVTRDLTDRLKAGAILKPVAARVGGRGGGRPDLAQAGGNEPARLDEALELVAGQVAQALG